MIAQSWMNIDLYRQNHFYLSLGVVSTTTYRRCTQFLARRRIPTSKKARATENKSEKVSNNARKLLSKLYHRKSRIEIKDLLQLLPQRLRHPPRDLHIPRPLTQIKRKRPIHIALTGPRAHEQAHHPRQRVTISSPTSSSESA
jgi:hypothetical protein